MCLGLVDWRVSTRALVSALLDTVERAAAVHSTRVCHIRAAQQLDCCRALEDARVLHDVGVTAPCKALVAHVVSQRVHQLWLDTYRANPVDTHKRGQHRLHQLGAEGAADEVERGEVTLHGWKEVVPCNEQLQNVRQAEVRCDVEGSDAVVCRGSGGGADLEHRGDRTTVRGGRGEVESGEEAVRQDCVDVQVLGGRVQREDGTGVAASGGSVERGGLVGRRRVWVCAVVQEGLHDRGRVDVEADTCIGLHIISRVRPNKSLVCRDCLLGMSVNK